MHPSSLNLGNVETRQARSLPAPQPDPVQLTLPKGQKIEKPGPLLSPVPKPDDIHKHTHARTPNARVQG